MSTLTNVELVMWSNIGGEAPTVSAVRTALMANGFAGTHAEDIPITTAFRRATKEMASGPELKITTWAKDKETGAQLDRLILDEITARIRREYIASWRIGDDGIVHSSDLAGAIDLAGHRSRYTWADVTGIIRKVMEKDGLGSFSPRKSGGVYFVPIASKTILDRLESACKAVGLNFLRYQVPDTDAHRAEVADAIVASFEADIEVHTDAIAEYAADRTAAGVVRNRGDAIDATIFLIQRMAPHMAQRVGPLVERCGQLKNQCDELESQIKALRPVATGGRRIVTSAVPA